MKYLVDATLTIGLEEVRIRLDDPPKNEQDLNDAIMDLIHERLTYLDVMGGRSGEDGVISSVVCDSVDNWTAE